MLYRMLIVDWYSCLYSYSSTSTRTCVIIKYSDSYSHILQVLVLVLVLVNLVLAPALLRIFRSSSLNLHTFHLIDIVFWWQIFFRKHGKSTPNDRQDHHVLVLDVVIMTSQCRCTRALSQSHVARHDNHVLVMLLIGSGTGCHVDAMAAVWQNYISAKKNKSSQRLPNTPIFQHQWMPCQLTVPRIRTRNRSQGTKSEGSI